MTEHEILELVEAHENELHAVEAETLAKVRKKLFPLYLKAELGVDALNGESAKRILKDIFFALGEAGVLF